MSKRLDLDRLRQRAGQRPRTKVGQVRQAWPEIKQLQAAGHSLKDIWEWLNEIGVDIGYSNLSHCLSRLRRREKNTESQVQELLRGWALVPQEQLPQKPPEPRSQPLQTTSDPLRNLRQQRAKKKGFEYDPFPTKGLTQ